MMLKNYNNILLFKDLIELCERILVFRFEKNIDFIIQLAFYKDILFKAMNLKFSKLQMGLYYYPALYESTLLKKEDGSELSDKEKKDIEDRVAKEREKLNEGDFDLIDKRLEEMAQWYNKCYKSIGFENLRNFYDKVLVEICKDVPLEEYNSHD